MRVLGVDPGLTRCGVGVVEGDLGRRLTMVVVAALLDPRWLVEVELDAVLRG